MAVDLLVGADVEPALIVAGEVDELALRAGLEVGFLNILRLLHSIFQPK